MKKYPIVLVMVLLMNPAFAEYVWLNSLVPVGQKAYSLQENADDGNSEIVQYSFPELVELKRVNLGDIFYQVDASEAGVLVTEYTYGESPNNSHDDDDDDDDESEDESEDEENSLKRVGVKLTKKLRDKSGNFAPATPVVYTETITNTSYDTDLNKVAELELEYNYSYFWTDYDELDDEDIATAGVEQEPSSKCNSNRKKKGKKDCVKVQL